MNEEQSRRHDDLVREIQKVVRKFYDLTDEYSDPVEYMTKEEATEYVFRPSAKCHVSNIITYPEKDGHTVIVRFTDK